jgi:hypothetical protein
MAIPRESFRAIAGLNPQVKRKILSDNLRRKPYSLRIGRLEQLEQSVALERLELALFQTNAYRLELLQENEVLKLEKYDSVAEIF